VNGIQNQRTPDPDTLDDLQPGIAQNWPPPMLGLGSHIPELKLTAEFIQLLQNACLENSNMDPEDIHLLLNPPTSVSDILDDKNFVKAMKVFLVMTNSSEATYESVRAAVMECYPEDPFLSYKQVRRRVESISGISPILHDMCIDTCAAFTGPFNELEACPIFSSPRYHPGTNNPN
jgi:hypothetical protein